MMKETEHIVGRSIEYFPLKDKKTADYIDGTPIKAALVSTNSITQGEQVANLWKPLMDKGIHINFAWRTFIWDSQASAKAHVHCVIVGFSYGDKCNTAKTLYLSNKECHEVHNINAYLLDAGNVFVESRSSQYAMYQESA